MKRLLLLVVCFAAINTPAVLMGCDKCASAAQKTIAGCNACIKGVKPCFDRATKLTKECDNCKSLGSKIKKRCTVAIVFCNWCIATCNNYCTIADKIAQKECKTYCEKAIAKLKKCSGYCKKSVKPLKECKNKKLGKKAVAHQNLSESCKTCEIECQACIELCESCISKLDRCEKK